MDCWKTLSSVCRNIGCRYFIEMTEEGKIKYKNCAMLASQRPHTLHEISVILGISRERVRQIQASALKRMARNLTYGLDLNIVDEVIDKKNHSDVTALNFLDEKGVLWGFIRAKVGTKVLQEETKCPEIKRTVRRIVCLLCPNKLKCKVKLVTSKYLKVTSLEDVLVHLKEHPPSTKHTLKEKIEAYFEEHPNASYTQVASNVGASCTYVRRLVVEGRLNGKKVENKRQPI